jgi:adenine-specific DNA-methyltransferase
LVSLRSAFARSRGVQVGELQLAHGGALDDELDRFTLANAERVVQLARVLPKDVGAEARVQLDLSIKTPGRVFRAKREGKGDVFFLNGKQIIFYASKVREIDGIRTAGLPLSTIWDDVPSNNVHKEGGVRFPNGKKPEALIKRVIELSTKRGDIVLDSFAGSGTTGAVAHKMGRRWIMVELGDHCTTHVLPRLKAVVDGNDPDGVTRALGWRGGGGFRFYRLAPSLLERDKWGNWVINKTYNKEMLAEAMCKLEGFRYAPSQTAFWQHGQSTERDFIYVTTQTLTHEQLAAISEEVGPERTLLVCCSAFRAKLENLPNLTVKKIPATVLARCEWGKDDYSLNVRNVMGEDVVPDEPLAAASSPEGPATPATRRRKTKAVAVQELLPLNPRGAK